MIARARPDAEVLAVDINPRALRLTAVNAELAGLVNVSAYHSDVLGSVQGEFDFDHGANPAIPTMTANAPIGMAAGRWGEGTVGAYCRRVVPRLALGCSLVLYTGGGDRRRGRPFPEGGHAFIGQRCCRWAGPIAKLYPDVFGEELDKPGYERVERIAVVALTVTRLF